ncbi:hypothetical protein [Sunxiuqinia dokdonensis]|uniref:Lipoprotein n=1 Tax=Sunxiuqinia dokdonensis TaxID=1409788 RepID=A0A0L8VAC8_9BACT|nr:hypothetical protein [Sunxiuqinia dokdonensis]KOH45399.1 hypothetical protein NC99_17750 [Sunxiuqinia dokdonensis]
MKTAILKISVFLLLFSLMGAGCEKDEEPEIKELNYLKVAGLSLQGDTCFIKKGETKDFNLEINSQEEFEEYFDCKIDFSPQIDFSQYTLLAGSRIVNCIYPSLVLQKILFDDESKTVQFKAQFEYDSGCYPSFGVIYFHALIPKLDNNYKVSFNVDIITDEK